MRSVAAAAQLPSHRPHALAFRPGAAPQRLPVRNVIALANSGRQHVDTARPAQQQQGETTNPTNQQAAAVQLLERSYGQASAPSSPVPPAKHSAAADSKLRPLVIRSALPVLRTIRVTERRLEADLLTIAATVMLVVGYIIWDRGVEEMLDNLLGDGPKGSIFCILFGLGLVVGVRVTGGKVSKLFSI